MRVTLMIGVLVASATANAEGKWIEYGEDNRPQAVEERPTETEVDALREALDTDDVKARRRAVKLFLAEHAPAPVAASEDPAAPSSKSRTALLDDLGALFGSSGPEVRAGLARKLGATKETGLVPVLDYVARRDRDETVRIESARALGGYPGDVTNTRLDAIAFDRTETGAVRAAAIEAAAAQEYGAFGGRLAMLATDLEEPVMVRQSATDALRKHYPALAARLPLNEKAVETSGRWLAVLAGAFSGAYTLGLVGSLSSSTDPGTGIAAGIAGGVVIGGAGTYLLTRSSPVSLADAGLLASVAGWSVPIGYDAGSTLPGTLNSFGARDNRRGNALQLGAHVLLMGAAVLGRDALAFENADLVDLNLSALAGLFIGTGFTQVLRGFDPVTFGQSPTTLAYGLSAGATTLGLVGGALAAKSLRLDMPSLALSAVVSAGTAWGLAYIVDGVVADQLPDGPIGTVTFNEKGARLINSMPWFGLGVGLAGSLALTHWWHPSFSDTGLVLLGGVTGAFLGHGPTRLLRLGEATGDGEWPTDTISGAGALIGMLAGGLAAEELGLKLERGDGLLMTLGLGWALWQGYGWASYIQQGRGFSSDRQSRGFADTFVSFAALGMFPLTQVLELTPGQAGWLYSGAAWGAWLGSWGAFATHQTDRNRLLTSLVATNVGLAITAVLVSPLVGVDPSMLAWANAFGVVGMTLSVMGAVFIHYDPNSDDRTVSTANIVGSVVGLAIGTALAPRLAPLGFPGMSSGSGGDLGIPMPAIAIMPTTDREGQIAGTGVSLAWSM